MSSIFVPSKTGRRDWRIVRTGARISSDPSIANAEKETSTMRKPRFCRCSVGLMTTPGFSSRAVWMPSLRTGRECWRPKALEEATQVCSEKNGKNKLIRLDS